MAVTPIRRFDETGVSPGSVCGNANPNVGPINSDWADSVSVRACCC